MSHSSRSSSARKYFCFGKLNNYSLCQCAQRTLNHKDLKDFAGKTVPPVKLNQDFLLVTANYCRLKFSTDKIIRVESRINHIGHPVISLSARCKAFQYEFQPHGMHSSARDRRFFFLLHSQFQTWQFLGHKLSLISPVQRHVLLPAWVFVYQSIQLEISQQSA
ncbi:MAG: hypothetical protein CM1200mP28_12090 [Deltaproteobacteria bacterium]|nr:MAG: hypothetical protein CM1200mP28_12090 [Deltaproteobacteria bacterium]